MRRFVRNKSSVMGFVILVLIIIMAIIGPYISGHGIHQQRQRFEQMPAKIPLLSKLGIADGTRKYKQQNVEFIKSIDEVDPLTKTTKITFL